MRYVLGVRARKRVRFGIRIRVPVTVWTKLRVKMSYGLDQTEGQNELRFGPK